MAPVKEEEEEEEQRHERHDIGCPQKGFGYSGTNIRGPGL